MEDNRLLLRANLSMGAGWLLWSLSAIMIRLVGDSVPRPIVSGMADTMGGALLLIPAIRCMRYFFKDRKLLPLFIVYVLLCTALAELCFAFAVKNLNPGLVGLILRSQVVMAILAAWFFLQEKPNALTSLGMLIIVGGHLFGAYLSMHAPSATANGVERNAALGWMFAIAASVLWTGGTLIGKVLLKKVKARELCGYRMLMSGLVTLVLYTCFAGLEPYKALTSHQWLMLALKGTVCSVLPYTLYLYGLSHVQVTVAAAMEQASPLFTLLISTFLLHEAITGMQWLTVAIVTFGAAIIILQQLKPRRE